jgi:hypothetical protein
VSSFGALVLGIVKSAKFPKDLKLKKKIKKVNAIGALMLGIVTSAKFPKDLVPVFVTGYSFFLFFVTSTKFPKDLVPVYVTDYPLNSSRIP